MNGEPASEEWKLSPDEVRALLIAAYDNNPFLIEEAIASARLDRDERAQTICLCGGCEQCPPTSGPGRTTGGPRRAT